MIGRPHESRLRGFSAICSIRRYSPLSIISAEKITETPMLKQRQRPVHAVCDQVNPEAIATIPRPPSQNAAPRRVGL